MSIITVSSGVTSSDVSADEGVTVQVQSGGVLEAFTVLNGGLVDLAFGAVASGFTVSAGAVVSGPGAASGFDDDYGLVAGVSVGDYLAVYAGGVASATTVNSGFLTVYSGGEDAGGTILGGYEFVSSGGLISGTAVESGGREYLSAGSTASAVTVSSGGSVEFDQESDSGETVLIAASPPQGTASTTTTLSGVTVLSGGFIDVSETVSSGGTLELGSGVVFSGEITVSAGGSFFGPGTAAGSVFDEGSVAGLTVHGLLDIESGGVASALTLRGGATLELEGVTATSAGVDGLGQLVATSGGWWSPPLAWRRTTAI